MPSKQLTLAIPEPVDGVCSEDCPCRYVEHDGYIIDCTARLNRQPHFTWMGDPLVPGKGCPQFQGDPPRQTRPRRQL